MMISQFQQTGERRDNVAGNQSDAATRMTGNLPGPRATRPGRRRSVVAAAVGAEGRAEIGRWRDELTAWRGVVALVARGASPVEVLGAVAEEAGRLFGADDAAVTRFAPDGSSVLVVGLGECLGAVPAGTRWARHDHLITTTVWRTRGAARRDEDRSSGRSEQVADQLRGFGIRSVVAAPIVMSGRLWGAVVVSTNSQPLAPDTEDRMRSFSELVATAVGNAESRAELAASRGRVLAAMDQTRRRLERDLHDGAQQRLVSLGLQLRSVQGSVPPALGELREGIGRVADGLTEVLEGLRELSRGIHPTILAEGGLGPALRTLARRSPVPVELDVATPARFPEPVEVATYYIVSEALANAAKHARASQVGVAVRERDEALEFSVRDDGVGGADPGRGSGLLGLQDRVESLGGSIDVRSPAGDGTSVMVTLPIRPGRPGPSQGVPSL
jgi:signal transduction histidine kinase